MSGLLPAWPLAVRVLLALVLAAALLWTLAFAGLYLLQGSLLYGPPSGPPKPPPPGAADEALDLGPLGGALLRLHPPEPGRPILLFFGGNADALESPFHLARYLAPDRGGFAAVSYPGYEGNPGRPSEASLTAAGVEAAKRVRACFPESPLVVAGWSLGAGVASQAAARVRPDALLLFAPFRSAVSVAQNRWPIFPIAFAARDVFDSQKALAGAKFPIWIAHGTSDEVIPVEEGIGLAASLGIRPVLHPGFGHGPDWAASRAALPAFFAAVGISWSP